MKTWLAALSFVLVLTLLFIGIIIPNLDRENVKLQQRMLGAETSLNSLKKELNETADKNTALEEKMKNSERNLELSKEEFAGKIMITGEKLASAMENMKYMEEKITELEQNKAEKKELTIIESILTEDIKNLEKDIFKPSEIYEKVKKAIVTVKIGQDSRTGTGFLFENKSQIITNYHVVGSPPGTEVKILPNNGPYDEILGVVTKIKISQDLAAIELVVPLDAEPLMPGDIKHLKKGENVLVIGSPPKFTDSVSPGHINGLDRKTSKIPSMGMIQIDSAMIPGFSGGPLLNARGQVIGVTSMGLGDFKFAIPIDHVMRFLEVP